MRENIENEVNIQQPFLQEVLHQNVIKVTREIIRTMSQLQKFQKAKAHIMDALKYKHPRFESEALETPKLFKVMYNISSSSVWEWLLFIAGYAYLCLSILDKENYGQKIFFQLIFLIVFWIDMTMLLYCKKFDNFVKKNKYSNFFYFKFIMICLMTIDLLFFIYQPGEQNIRPIRPFRVLRSFIPFLYDAQMRKCVYALVSAYKDILVYFIFFVIIVVAFALIGSNTLTINPDYIDPNYPQPYDPYKTDYQNIGHMIFMVYVTATFDSYPDNQTLAMQNYQPNIVFFITFIFLNMFLFSSIPGSLIYLKFRDTRSKIILIDQIRQQHSLILAFVTLAQNESNLSIDKLIKFLLFLYRYKIRYVGYITDICLKLDDHNNNYIQVNQFMKFSKILLENSAMLPPSFDDLEIWMNFRKFLIAKFRIKDIVKHLAFEIVTSIVIILSTINAVFYLYKSSQFVDFVDSFFIWLFLLELIFRILAAGPEVFFSSKWNTLDSFLILFGILFFFVGRDNSDGIIRLWRIFRLDSTIDYFFSKFNDKKRKFEVYHKLKSIFAIILEILPVILRFMPLFLFFFYIYSIIGLQIFYDIYNVQGNPAYNQYEQFSNFKTIVNGMYIMVQILTEAGWSQIAFDHSWRASDYFTWIMIFFCFLHITIVYIIATLIKGVFWEVFFTVNIIYQERKMQLLEKQKKQKELCAKTTEIMQINDEIQNSEYIKPNTVLRRQLVENKFDLQIFRKLKKVYDNEKNTNRNYKSKKNSRAMRLIDDWDLSIDQLMSQRSKNKEKMKSVRSVSTHRSRLSLNEVEELDEEDLQSQIDELLGRMLINPIFKYNQLVAHPKNFTDFLRSKFINPEEMIKDYEFDLHLHPLHNQESMYYHIYQMNALLNIETSKRQQKALIIKSLIEENMIDEEQGQRLTKKKLQQKRFNLDTNGTLRRMFLDGTNQQLINKFQTEYFSNLYGSSYRQINKITLEPLLKLEATLTYTLKNIMRYPQINTIEFFEMITNIQSQISNKLLQRGSLFKFVYKLKYEGDIWFSIEYKRQQQMRVHFIKSGIWCYRKEMPDSQTIYSRDIFNWNLQNRGDSVNCQNYLKRFYQAFEGLSFSLLEEEVFFQTDPKQTIYDLYIQHYDTDHLDRRKQRKLEISKIMVVVLSKQQSRCDLGLSDLPHCFSDIEKKQNIKEKKSKLDFKLDQSDDKTFQKLKNLAAIETDKIAQNQGLPFSYIINLMKEINDILTINGENFIYQIEKVLNEQYQEVNRMDFSNQLNSQRPFYESNQSNR